MISSFNRDKKNSSDDISLTFTGIGPNLIMNCLFSFYLSIELVYNQIHQKIF